SSGSVPCAHPLSGVWPNSGIDRTLVIFIGSVFCLVSGLFDRHGVLDVFTEEPGVAMNVVDGKSGPRTIRGAVGEGTMDRQPGEVDARAARNGQPDDAGGIQIVYFKGDQGLVPAFAVPVAHGVARLPGGVLLRIHVPMGRAQAALVAAGNHTQP